LTSLETVSGSGDFKDATLISFSYSEDASPISPANLNGGTGQVTAQLVSDVSTRGSRVAINNEAILSDEEYGDVSFTVKKLSFNDDLVSLVGETVQARLDVERTALPQGSDAGGYTLAAAIEYYCSLVGVVPSFESGLYDKLDAIDVDFVGWKGNVWEHLKMLCAASYVDENDSSFIEMYILNDELWFRQGGQSDIDTAQIISDETIEIDAYDAAQTVSVIKYNTDYRANSLIRQQNIDALNYANLEFVSIVDSFQVSANEKITRRVLVNASLESVEQPIAVQSIALPVTYSQYVIVGKDGIPLTPAQWNGQGGSVTIELTENPNEIEITVVGANYPELEPFKIGVESAGGDDYPAFYLRGTGVFFEKTEHTIYTGAPASEIQDATTIDNPFIVNDRILWSKGVRIAQELCGPSFKLNQSIPMGVEFGNVTGSIVSAFDSKFRIESTGFSQSGVDIQARSYVTFADFDTAWSGSTIEDFNNSMSNISFNEFSVIALTKE
jgi:hypothetical protein